MFNLRLVAYRKLIVYCHDSVTERLKVKVE